jgi:hypothetical protein
MSQKVGLYMNNVEPMLEVPLTYPLYLFPFPYHVAVPICRLTKIQLAKNAKPTEKLALPSNMQSFISGDT